MFNAIRQKTYCNKEEEDGWNEGEADEGDYQFGPELRSQDLPLPFEDQFHQVSDHQKDQKKDQNDVDIDEAENNDVVGNRNAP